MSPDSFHPDTLERITQNPNILRGKPCVRGLRISVSQVVQMLPAGMTAVEIVEEFPDLVLEWCSKTSPLACSSLAGFDTAGKPLSNELPPGELVSVSAVEGLRAV